MSLPVWTLDQIANWTKGKIISSHKKIFSFVGTDTRKNLSDQVFVALKGDQFDAHDYLEKATAQGAGVLLVHRLDEKFEALKTQVSIILVDDTLKALQDFAHHYRQSLSTKIIGITGSNGKTSTKEFTAALLNNFKKTHFNSGSFNNHWGVPLTLLQIPTDAAFAIIEMGMNHAGEIKQLVEIADPDFVVCTMVGHAHIEYFGSQKKIAEAKAEIYNESRESTVRIFNQDQDLTFDMMYPVAKKFPASRMLSFSAINNEADVFMQIIEFSSSGLKVQGLIGGHAGDAVIPVFGQHNLVNIMAAANIAYAVGMSPAKIWSALRDCKSTWGRNQFIESNSGVHILFDGYNANPDSMYALLKNLVELKIPGRKMGVFGQMKELGLHAGSMHQELAAVVAKCGYDFVYFIGENFIDFKSGLDSVNYTNYLVDYDLTESMGQHFIQNLRKDDLVTIKGSRGAKTERFVELCDPVDWSPKY